MRASTISLSESSRRIRRGTDLKKERQFLDFVVDGVSLYGLIGERYDLISVLGFDLWPGVVDEILSQLKGLARSEAPANRVPVYVCAECSDLDCGALTVEVVREGEIVQWRNWGYQNSYDADILPHNVVGLNDMEFLSSDLDVALDKFGRLFEV